LEEPFEATAELARYHLRSAVTNLLERPPVQGRAARERVFQDIRSEYFPTDSELAIKYFQKGPLARARLTLIKDVVLGLTVSLLIENLLDDERARQFSAIHAISSMYPEKTREILNDKLSEIILNKVDDDNWDKVIIYLGKINIWDYLSEPCQIKGVAFIEKLKLFNKECYGQSASHENLDMLLIANSISFLKETLKAKLQLPVDKLLSLKESYEDKSQYHLINKTIEPILEKSLPNATFDELISMISKESFSLNEKIQPYLIDKINKASLGEILDGLSQVEQKDKPLLYEAIENRLPFLLNNISLEELLKIRQNYKRLLSKKKLKVLTDKLDNSVTQLFEQEKVDDLILIFPNYCNDKLFEKLLKPLLKDNISKIINYFKLSSSFDNAAGYANLLNEVADFINTTQWQEIIDAFFENSQIYNSRNCASTFESLFKKSIDLDISIKPYWLFFRKKLNTFSLNDRDINSLKKVIDSQLEAE
ncbi:MAG: hypothetical protein HC907_27635, partial [Richelia sp. SM1_7_0]|nr:hypothetical protein [Richelia sp. SM1_7_0]